MLDAPGALITYRPVGLFDKQGRDLYATVQETNVMYDHATNAVCIVDRSVWYIDGTTNLNKSARNKDPAFVIANVENAKGRTSNAARLVFVLTPRVFGWCDFHNHEWKALETEDVQAAEVPRDR